MFSCFIDTSDHLVFGILDADFGWIDFCNLEQVKKSSSNLHGELFKIIQNNNLKIRDMKNLFFAAGPGSYTGIRLTQGLSDILSWQGIDTYSFYHFEVPQILGVKSGMWATFAFKREVFFYEWDEGSASKMFVKESEANFDGVLNNQDTANLIESNSNTLFSHVYQKKMKNPPFYFRPLSQEFPS